MRLLYGNLKVLEVDFTKCSLANASIILIAVGFLIVPGIMLHGHANSLALDAIDVGGAHFSGKQRILRKIFEVPAAKRVSMNVHARSKKDINPILQHLVAHS